MGSPLVVYPELERRLRQEADRTARPLTRGGSVRFESGDGAVSMGFDRLEVSLGRARGQVVAPDGLLVFAVDVAASAYVDGSLVLDPTDDLRPGLRATVLSDTTVVATPMIAASEWRLDKVTDAAPIIAGASPAREIALNRWLLSPGRHYLTVAGPHARAAGTFASLEIRSVDRAVEAPAYTFALIGDTHVHFKGREEWMNIKMGDVSPAMFAATLQELSKDGIAFVMHGGDMTESAVRDEFAMMSGLLKAHPLPVYGCMGNHDVYFESSRPDARELLADHFPGGSLDYVLGKPPIRFVVLDVEIEKPEMTEKKQEWLRQALAADTTTPTIFLWHYAPYNRAGVSSCGLRMFDWSELGKSALLPIVQAAPNVFATLNGHDHWDEVNTLQGITHIQNAAFVEWPNSYRVFRVYADRMEWEVRQVSNRGFIRESFLPAKGVSWMIATGEGDLTGEVKLRRNK